MDEVVEPQPSQEEKDEAALVAERAALAKRIKSFKAAGESGGPTPSIGLNARKDRYKSIDVYHTDRKHWNDDDQLLPRIPLTWYHVDSLTADIGKRPHDPKVVAEQATAFPGPEQWANALPWLETKEKLQQVLAERYQARSDNEIAADFFTAILDVYREKACIDPQRATARRVKLTYGDVFWHNGYDPELEIYGKCPHFADVYKPDCVGADPKATRWVGNDFNGKYAFLKVETTLRDLKAEYPKTAKEIVTTDDKNQGSGDEALDPLDRTIDKYLFWIRDTHTKETIEEEYEEEQPVIVEGQQLYQTDEMEMPVLGEDGLPLPLTKTVVKTRPVEVPKYPSGWLFAVWCNDKVLDFGPADEFPLHRDYCYEIPGQVFAHGVVDVVRTFNTQANRFYDQIIKNTERTGDNIVFVNAQGDYAEAEKVLKGKATVVKVEGDPSGKVVVSQGVTAADGLFRALEFNLKLAEQVTGNIDAMSQENLPRTASGKYVYAAESGQQARITEVAKHSDDCERSLYRSIIRQSLKNDTEEMALKVRTAGQEVDVPFTPNTLDTQDFEIKWDISLDGAPQESPDPAERNQQRRELIPYLIQFSKTIAMGILEEQDVPNKESIRATLEQHYSEQEDAAQQGPQMDPVEQAKAAGQNAKDVSQALQGIATTVAKIGESTKNMALISGAVRLLLEGVNVSQQIASGQAPDYTAINMVMDEISLIQPTMHEEPEPEPTGLPQ
jgi:hypothetical protein